MTNRYRFDAKEHVHLLDNRPLIGTSSVGNVIAKPLVWWSAGLAVQAFGCPDAKILTKVKNGKATKAETESLYTSACEWMNNNNTLNAVELVKLWDKAYRAHQTTLTKTADKGVDLHAELERFVRDEMTGEQPKSVDEYDAKILPFIEWSRANVKTYLFSEAHCYSETHWLGGITDCGAVLNDDTAGIIDFKSAKAVYLTAHWQAAGYCEQVEGNGIFDADGNQLDFTKRQFDWTAVVAFGAPEVVPHFNVDLAECKRNFMHCLALHKALPR